MSGRMKEYANSILKIAASILAVGCTGCQHEMEVMNLYQYTQHNAIDKVQEGLTIALIPRDRSQMDFYRHVAVEMEHLGGYRVSVLENIDLADITIDIAYSCDEISDWKNFFVCMPGFLIFTHAWLGYGYEYVAKWRTIAFDKNSSRKLFDAPIDMKLEFRYAQLGTAWANNFGFFYGVPALVNGICVQFYDKWATTELIRTTEKDVARYLAHQLVLKINENQ